MEKIKLQFLQAELNRVSDWIRFADQKSAFLSVYYSAIFVFIISYKEKIQCSISIFENWSLYFYIYLLISIAILFFVGFFFLFCSVFPRLKNHFTNKSLFYFGCISKTKMVDYLKQIEELTEEESKKQILEQIYSNSIIADQKMKNVQNSTRILFILAVFIIVLSII